MVYILLDTFNRIITKIIVLPVKEKCWNNNSQDFYTNHRVRPSSDSNGSNLLKDYIICMIQPFDNKTFVLQSPSKKFIECV